MSLSVRIINGLDFGGIYTFEFLYENWDNVINGQIVSEWQFTQTLPNPELKKPKWNDSEWVEGITQEEITDLKIKQAIEIDLEYTRKIDELMTKHHNKVIQAIYFGTTYVIPQIALDEMQALKDECNAKILALGITDFSYRQNIPKLAKTEIIK